MHVEDLIKDNLDIFGKKREIMSKRQLGVALDNFMLKEQRHAINDTTNETFIRQQKSMIKSKRGKDKEDQEDRPTFMTTTDATVQEVGMVEGDRARERSNAENKGKKEKR